MKKYHFFWSGPFSQWFKSDIEIDGVVYCSCEQYMMYRKAMLFGDYDAASKIMATRNPKEQKAIGRTVRGFDKAVWEEHAQNIVYVANYAKFTQNPELNKYLMSIDAEIFVEASPLDAIWGIGYPEDTAMENIDRWGTNWLGEAITRVRNNLRETQ